MCSPRKGNFENITRRFLSLMEDDDDSNLVILDLGSINEFEEIIIEAINLDYGSHIIQEKSGNYKKEYLRYT